MTVCESCRFFEPVATGATGECRRYAPSLHGGPSTMAQWPQTAAACWCGEFSPRDLPPMPPGMIEVRQDPAAEFFEWLKARIAFCAHGQVCVTCGPCIAPWLQR